MITIGAWTCTFCGVIANFDTGEQWQQLVAGPGAKFVKVYEAVAVFVGLLEGRGSLALAHIFVARLEKPDRGGE